MYQIGHTFQVIVQDSTKDLFFERKREVFKGCIIYAQSMDKESGRETFQLGLKYDNLTKGLRDRYGVIYQLALIPTRDYWLFPDESTQAVAEHIIHGISFLEIHGEDQFLRNLGRDADALIKQGRVGIIPTRDMRWELWKANFPARVREQVPNGIPQFDASYSIPVGSDIKRYLQIFVPVPEFLMKVRDPTLLMAEVSLMASMMKDILHGREDIDPEKIDRRARAFMSHFLHLHIPDSARATVPEIHQKVLDEFPCGLILGCDNILYGEDSDISDPWEDWDEYNYG